MKIKVRISSIFPTYSRRLRNTCVQCLNSGLKNAFVFNLLYFQNTITNPKTTTWTVEINIPMIIWASFYSIPMSYTSATKRCLNNPILRSRENRLQWRSRRRNLPSTQWFNPWLADIIHEILRQKIVHDDWERISLLFGIIFINENVLGNEDWVVEKVGFQAYSDVVTTCVIGSGPTYFLSDNKRKFASLA